MAVPHLAQALDMISKVPQFVILFASLILCMIGIVSAQTKLDDPEDVRKNIFWNQLYAKGGKSLYCARPFTEKNRRMEPSYIFPLSDIRRYMDCGTPRQCVRESESYRFAASDLHNIYPALSRIALDRRNAQFGELGDVPEKFPRLNCDYRSQYKVTEPADNIKGDIARALLYMQLTYGLRFPVSIPIEVIIAWNELDLPDEKEKARNNLVESIQGTRNPYVDNPEQVNELKHNGAISLSQLRTKIIK